MKVLVHDRTKPTSLPSNEVTSLATDRSGVLWVGTDAGLTRWNATDDTFVHYRDPKQDPQGLLADAISVLFVDSSNTLWVGLAQGGVARIDGRTGAARFLPLLKESGLSSVAERPDGAILLGSRGEGVLVYDVKSDSVTERYTSEGRSRVRLPMDDITALHVDARGRTWIGTESAGVTVVDKAGTVTRYTHENEDPRSLSDSKILSVFGGPDGSTWIGTRGAGLNQFDEETGGFVRHTGDPADRDRLSQAWVTAGLMSRDGVAWVATQAGDLNYFDGLSLAFKYYRTASTPITAIVEDAADPNVFWMGSGPGMERSGLYRVDRRTGRYALYQGLAAPGGMLNLDQAWIASLYSDKTGTIWIGTHELGLIEFHPSTDKVAQHRIAADEAGNVSFITGDRDGALWLASWGSGLVKLRPATGEIERFAPEENDERSISSDHLYTLAWDAKDPRVLWVGTAEGGLNRFDTTQGNATRFAHVREDVNSLSNNNVTSIHQDAVGRLWIGTFGGGLNLFDPTAKKWTRYDAPGQPSTVYGILEDKSGSLWLSTNGAGLKVLDPKTNQILGYTGRDGLQADEFAQGGYARGASGLFYFSGVKGASVFSPESIRPDSFAPPVMLTGFRVFDETREVPAASAVKLSYLDSVVTFDYAALAFADPRRTSYEYRLTGLHDRWIPTRQGSVTYTNLDPGSYVFELRARGRHGAASLAGLTVPLVVSPPPWLTWWAYGLYALAAVALVLAIIQYQRRKLVRLAQRNRLALVEREIQLTAAVQTGFLPDASEVQEDGFGLVGVYRPADKCGGDWWWHERINDHLHVVACGDVTGHGAGPAMVTAAVSTTFRVLREVWAESGPTEFLRMANDQVMRSGRGRYLMHMVVAEFDTMTGRLSLYSAAGFPAVCRVGEESKVFSARGVPLGSQPFDVTVVNTTLSPGDRFMLLTDGIPEIEMGNGRRLGLRRLTKLYDESCALPLSDAAAHVLAAAESANHNGAQEDDWTFVMAEWTRRVDGQALSRPSGRAAHF